MLLQVEGLRKNFGGRTAVDGVSFQLKPGETLGVVGESGCGKSTLGRVLALLEDATSGELLIDGRPTEGEFKPEDSLEPVAKRLAELLGRDVPLVRDWGYFTPKIGLHMTQYETDALASSGLPAARLTRQVPISSPRGIASRADKAQPTTTRITLMPMSPSRSSSHQALVRSSTLAGLGGWEVASIASAASPTLISGCYTTPSGGRGDDRGHAAARRRGFLPPGAAVR